MPKFNYKLSLYLFFIIYFLVGLSIYKDFGVGIEEHFQRHNGFYWLNQLLSYTGFEDFKNLVNLKYQQISIVDPDLPDPIFFNFYGILFDLPLAFIEVFLNLENSKIYFEIRHLAIFLIFYISSIFTFKILNNRFENKFVIFLGLIIYILSPRIFGDSFHNNKDILFLSILTISISYLFDLFTKHNNKNLLLFCFFAALASSSRIMGIYLPVILFILYFLELLIGKFSLKEFISRSLKLFIFFILFLYLHYPYMWQLNIFDIFGWFKSFFYWMDVEILFSGKYYSIKYLPRSYLPIWILISTPFFIIIFFILGTCISGKTILKRLLNIKEDKINKKGELWINLNEKKDFFIFVSFFSFISYAVLLNVAMLSGWRHFYFLHIFIIYLSTVGISWLYEYSKKFINEFVVVSVFIFLIISLCFTNYKFHPFQSLYFTNLLNKEDIKKFQVDSPSITRSSALKFISEIEKEKDKKIFVANASWTPLYNGKDMLENSIQKKFVFVGQEYNLADYVYTNFIFKDDEKYNKNFQIPKNFERIKDFKINDILIYSIYKKKK
tara:strand:+ start:4877 stop:6535 length:1659 start_codon:yes stop_codon:yes gene_type:complete